MVNLVTVPLTGRCRSRAVPCVVPTRLRPLWSYRDTCTHTQVLSIERHNSRGPYFRWHAQGRVISAVHEGVSKMVSKTNTVYLKIYSGSVVIIMQNVSLS